MVGRSKWKAMAAGGRRLSDPGGAATAGTGQPRARRADVLRSHFASLRKSRGGGAPAPPPPSQERHSNDDFTKSAAAASAFRPRRRDPESPALARTLGILVTPQESQPATPRTACGAIARSFSPAERRSFSSWRGSGPGNWTTTHQGASEMHVCTRMSLIRAIALCIALISLKSPAWSQTDSELTPKSATAATHASLESFAANLACRLPIATTSISTFFEAPRTGFGLVTSRPRGWPDDRSSCAPR